MKRLPKTKVPISISISLDMLNKIDEITYEKDITRSEFIVKAVKKELSKIGEGV